MAFILFMVSVSSARPERYAHAVDNDRNDLIPQDDLSLVPVLVLSERRPIR